MKLLRTIAGPWLRAREHAEAVALAAEFELERLFAEMRADLERPEILALIEAEKASGFDPGPLEAWLREKTLEEVRAFFQARREATSAPASEAPRSASSSPTLAEALAPAALALGVPDHVLLKAFTATRMATA